MTKHKVKRENVHNSKSVNYDGINHKSLSALWEYCKAKGMKLPGKSSFIRRAKYMPLEEALNVKIPFKITDPKKAASESINMLYFTNGIISEELIQSNIKRIVSRESKKEKAQFIEQSLDDIIKELWS